MRSYAGLRRASSRTTIRSPCRIARFGAQQESADRPCRFVRVKHAVREAIDLPSLK